MAYMSVTLLTSQLPMGLLKLLACYRTVKDGWLGGVSADLEAKGRATTTWRRVSNRREGRTRTSNIWRMLVTLLVSHAAMF
jgi:photosystem II stability/assembly factor-like uncharacterized protein